MKTSSSPCVLASFSRSETVPLALSAPLFISASLSQSIWASYMLLVLRRTVFPSFAIPFT